MPRCIELNFRHIKLLSEIITDFNLTSTVDSTVDITVDGTVDVRIIVSPAVDTIASKFFCANFYNEEVAMRC
jgi:hypothetical protein